MVLGIAPLVFVLFLGLFLVTAVVVAMDQRLVTIDHRFHDGHDSSDEGQDDEESSDWKLPDERCDFAHDCHFFPAAAAAVASAALPCLPWLFLRRAALLACFSKEIRPVFFSERLAF